MILVLIDLPRGHNFRCVRQQEGLQEQHAATRHVTLVTKGLEYTCGNCPDELEIKCEAQVAYANTCQKKDTRINAINEHIQETLPPPKPEKLSSCIKSKEKITHVEFRLQIVAAADQTSLLKAARSSISSSAPGKIPEDLIPSA